jgi:hypothetical protein
MRSVAALLLAATFAALSACSAPAEPPAAGPSPTTAATPIFASDEEALAAAEEAYSEYLRMSDEIASDGGKDPERLREYVSGDALQQDLETFESFANRALTGQGRTAYQSMELQQADLGEGRLRVYVCLDVSAADVVDSSGETVVDSDRPQVIPLEVAFERDPAADRLMITESAPWSGGDYCN